MREKSIPSICAPIAYITLSISMALTLMFMIKLAGDDNILKGVFITVGLVIEVIKAILPIVIFYTFAKRQWAFGCMLAAMYLVMAAISFSSSAAALEERINKSLSVSVESATNLEKIGIIKQEIEDKRVLFAEQQQANQISKMDTTSSEISQLNEQVLQLMSVSQKAQDTVLSRYKELLIYSIAGLIEVISPVMALIIMLSDTSRSPRNQEDGVLALIQQQSEVLAELAEANKTSETTPRDDNRSEQPTKTFTSKKTIELEQEKNSKHNAESEVQVNVYSALIEQDKTPEKLTEKDEESVTKVTPMIPFELYEDIKNQILQKIVKPTFRDISDRYKLGRDEISQLLKKMEDDGYLCCGKGNRYTVNSSKV